MMHAHSVALVAAIAIHFVGPAKAADLKPSGPTTPAMLDAIQRLNDAGVVQEKRGSLTFFRWSNAQPPQLVRIGLWGAATDNKLLALTATMPDLEAVSLYETSVDDVTVGHLQDCRRLNHLTFGNREIAADELRRLAACKSLRKLVLSCATLSDEAL